MDDAYVIGIRLALDNGVSAGVAAIGQDLAALDVQIAATAANLRRLTESAAVTTAAAAGDLARLTREPRGTTVEPQPPSDPFRPESPMVASPSSASRESTAARHLSQTAAPAPSLIPSESSNAPPPQVSITLAPVVTPEAPRAPAVPPAATAPPLQPAPTARVIETAAPSPPPIIRILSPSQKPDLPQSAPVSRQPSERPGVSPQELPWSPAATVTPFMIPATGAVPQPATAAPLSPLLPQSAAPRPVQPMSAETPIARSPTTPGPSQTLPSVAPQSNQSGSTAMGGDVYLDGTRLGTWMTNHLAREASRPPSGATGFDPRMGITWPGAQQGG
jgi:hypothetical protein